VIRVMQRSGLVDIDADIDSIILKARELNPDYPGIIDLACWEIGRTWCRRPIQTVSDALPTMIVYMRKADQLEV